MFKFFKKKKVESPVDFIDVTGYGSARIIPKPKAPSNMKISSDGYVSIPAPTENSYLSPYTSTDSYSSPAQAPPTADDMNFLGAMANASSVLDAPPAQSSSAYPSSSASSYPSIPSSYPSSSYPSSQSYPSGSAMDDDKIYKILRKLDFLTEKLDLMEMKINRIEKKTGVVESI